MMNRFDFWSYIVSKFDLGSFTDIKIVFLFYIQKRMPLNNVICLTFFSLIHSRNMCFFFVLIQLKFRFLPCYIKQTFYSSFALNIFFLCFSTVNHWAYIVKNSCFDHIILMNSFLVFFFSTVNKFVFCTYKVSK